MCAVSMVGDHYGKKFDQDPWRDLITRTENSQTISRAEFESLKKEVSEMNKLLKQAINIDNKTNQPHCHNEDKIAMLRKIAEIVGVSIDEAFK